MSSHTGLMYSYFACTRFAPSSARQMLRTAWCISPDRHRSSSSSSSKSHSSSLSNSPAQLTLYTGTDCQLCDVAKGVLDDLAQEVSRAFPNLTFSHTVLRRSPSHYTCTTSGMTQCQMYKNTAGLINMIFLC